MPYVIAFLGGIITFISPCVLPLIPSYITYITGLSLADLQAEHPTHKVRRQIIIHSLLFIAGFTCVFVLLGASATFIAILLAVLPCPASPCAIISATRFDAPMMLAGATALSVEMSTKRFVP